MTDTNPAVLELDRTALCNELGLDPEQITALSIDVPARGQVIAKFEGRVTLTPDELDRILNVALKLRR